MNIKTEVAVSIFEPNVQDSIEVALIRCFHANQIRAILWKGRSLKDTSSDNGDIDVLVHSEDQQRARDLLVEQGLKLIRNASWRTQPFVSDWYGINKAALVHVQLYDRLVLGSYATTQLQVPNQDIIFDENQVYASDEIAAVLRICRATLCTRFHPGRSSTQLIKEARKLCASESRIYNTAEKLFDAETAKKIVLAFDSNNVKSLTKHLHENFQSHSPAGGVGFVAHLAKFASKFNRGWLGLAFLCRRKLPKPAPVIALIGSDGSGKSSAATVSFKQIGKKIDTKFVYFGTGDGKSSVLRLPLVFLKNNREKWLKRNPKSVSSISEDKSFTRSDEVPSFAKAAWAISVAFERQSKMKQAKRYAAAGFIVITDRYPQNEYAGIHDGPRLSEWLSKTNGFANSIRYRLAKWEERIYNRLSTTPPDLVILLDVDLETASGRRPDEKIEDLRRRIDVARKLKYLDSRKILINSTDPIDVVQTNVMNSMLKAAVGEN